MRHFAVSAIGRDRPGIVAAVSEVLLRYGGNIEDSHMTILRGHFTIMLIVSTTEGVDADDMRRGLDEVGRALELEAVSLREVTGIDAAEPAPSHVVTVYGVDHPGIVHAITSALAGKSVNITDLTTRLINEGNGKPLYAMLLEVTLPPGTSEETVEGSLASVKGEQGVELSIRPLDDDAL